jgi:UDP-glucose 4-epimerase
MAYYDVNLVGAVVLLQAMRRHEVRRLVFSSSCSIYGAAEHLPIVESSPVRPTNPYARTKAAIEQMLADLSAAEPGWSALSLRYFNPIGAHPSGRLGEDPRGVPANVLPYLLQVAVGRLEQLQVFGNDYGTPDGTAIRDYIHVVDVARGHRLALERLDDVTGHEGINLGTGRGTSVLELVRAVEAACGRELPHRIVARRPGDVAALIADPSWAQERLGWVAEHDLAAMCADAWRFQEVHPDGYVGPG